MIRQPSRLLLTRALDIRSDALLDQLEASILPVCPQCSGPHSLSQCPNWRGRRILAAGRPDRSSFEAEFHRLIRCKANLTKRQEGWVMGAFRELFSTPAADAATTGASNGHEG